MRSSLLALKRRAARRWQGKLFFFQAEDGMRYLTVTGVQTCALPISLLGNKNDPSAVSSGNESSGFVPLCQISVAFPFCRSATQIPQGVTRKGINGNFCSMPDRKSVV